MKRFAVELTRTAKNDLEEITKYIAEKIQAPYIARQNLITLYDAIESLAYMPTRCRRIYIKGTKLAHFRRLLVKNFSVVYFISDDDKVVVVSITYSKKDIWL